MHENRFWKNLVEGILRIFGRSPLIASILSVKLVERLSAVNEDGGRLVGGSRRKEKVRNGSVGV